MDSVVGYARFSAGKIPAIRNGKKEGWLLLVFTHWIVEGRGNPASTEWGLTTHGYQQVLILIVRQEIAH
jgi:hypothetical protein